MKALSCVLVMTGILFVATSQCLGFVRVERVSKARAKELGVAIRSDLTHTNEVRVSLEFEAKGELKEFDRAVLEIGSPAEGEPRVLSATLRPEHPTADKVVISFSVDSRTLPGSVLTLIVKGGPRAKWDAHAFRMGDFSEVSIVGRDPWVESCLKLFQTIKPGMTREQVEAMLPKDGGLQSVSPVRFSHPACAYSKVDVEFDFQRNAADQGRAIPGMADKVTKVSRPYLEAPFVD